MKKKFTISMAMAGIFALATSEVVFTENAHGDGSRFPNGIVGRTGANGGPTCTACHGGDLNTGGGSITINTDIPNFKYQLGKEYNISVTITDSKAIKYGLNFTAIKSADTTKRGTLIAGEDTQVLKGEIAHNNPTASKTFNFKWKAPVTAAGIGAINNITFYVAGNAANGDGKKTGDAIYATNQVISLDPSSSDVEKNATVVKDLSIYPNPAVDVITVSYTLSKVQQIDIQLTGLNGQVVANLLQEQQSAGLQNKVFQLPSAISSGIYLLTIKGEEANVYNKLIVKK